MVRIATEQDAAQLQMLNNEFNGEGETTMENIRTFLFQCVERAGTIILCL